MAQCADPLRHIVDPCKQLVYRPGQVESHNLQLFAGVSDAMRHRLRLSLRVDQQPARQVEGSGIRE